MPATSLERLRSLAADIEGIDVDCYRRHGRDPQEPLVGLGRPDAKWCFFGRDPGEHEVRLHRPFVGPAGQKIRAVMAEFGLGDDDVYWMNTVPFKPIGNKAWSLAVQRRCRPALLELLAAWRGTGVIAFGEAATKWFGLGSAEHRQCIQRFWTRNDRYEAQLPITLDLHGARRRFMLHPLPHPSGANAAWASRFPDLFRARLRACSPA